MKKGDLTERLLRYLLDYPGQTAWEVSAGVSHNYPVVASRLHKLFVADRVLRTRAPKVKRQPRAYRYYVSYFVHPQRRTPC